MSFINVCFELNSRSKSFILCSPSSRSEITSNRYFNNFLDGFSSGNLGKQLKSAQKRSCLRHIRFLNLMDFGLISINRWFGNFQGEPCPTQAYPCCNNCIFSSILKGWALMSLKVLVKLKSYICFTFKLN